MIGVYFTFTFRFDKTALGVIRRVNARAPAPYASMPP